MPFDSENLIVFSLGLLTGSKALSSSRIHISSVSPISGYLGSSSSGGFFGAKMRNANIISLIIKGKANKPVYIYISDKGIEIKDASHLWGLGTEETEKKILHEYGDPKIQVATIGPAGENLVKIASIHFPYISNAAGRTGIGAVMGSKHLKAIAVRVSKSIRSQSEKGISEMNKKIVEVMKKSPNWEEVSNYGGSTFVSFVNNLGAQCSYNYRDAMFNEINSACGSAIKNNRIKNISCWNCPVHCKSIVKISNERHNNFVGDRPFYEVFSGFGPRCGNTDARDSVYLYNLCNQLGIDAVDAGGLIAFAMDLYERGILSDKDTNSLKLSWGDVIVIEKLIKQISFRNTWLGDTLSHGLKEAAKIIGKESENYAYHVKGLSITGMDPRGFKAAALAYAVGNRGADYTSNLTGPEFTFTKEKAEKYFGTKKAANRLSIKGKPLMLKHTSFLSAVMDSLGLCKIAYTEVLYDWNLNYSREILNAITGLDISNKELFKCGERIINLERMFNLSQGLSNKDDVLPNYFLNEAIKEGPSKGSIVELEKMKTEYYRLMGWTDKGIPIMEKMEELELNGLDSVKKYRN